MSIPTYFACAGGGSFFGLPTWYHYLPCNGDGNPSLTHLTDVWLIVAAIIEILLRIAALAAVGYVIYGGVEYTISRGEPDKTAKARGTIINAVIGLVIAITAPAIVSVLASKFK